MTPLFSPRCVLPVLSLLALLIAPACTTRTAMVAPPLEALDYAGSELALEKLDTEISAAGTDAARLGLIGERLTALLRDPRTTSAARQAICQRLSLVPATILTSAENTPLFVAMLRDDKQVNFARLALDRVPDPGVDGLYLAALSQSAGFSRLALVQSIGNRRIATAVPALTQLLGQDDQPTAFAAIRALGQIGTTEASAALASAPQPSSPQVVAARLAAAHQLPAGEASRIYQEIIDLPDAPDNLRAAAFRGWLFAEPEAAPARFVAALSRNEPVLNAVAVEAIASHPAPGLSTTLAAQLPTFNPSTQAAVIAALGNRGDAAVVPALSTATQHTEAEVRSAAILALGRLPGTPETAHLLAGIAAGDNVDDAKIARQSLARLSGPGVSERVIEGATSGEQPLRVVYLEQLSYHQSPASVSLLLGTRQDPSPAIRSAALNALAEVGSPAEQRAILDWTIAATHATEQARALRALATVTLRDPDITRRSLIIIDAIEKAEPAIATRLLPVLSRISGANSAEVASRLALRNDPKLSTAAIALLSRWSDGDGLGPLVKVAETTNDPLTRSRAIEGVVRYLERSRELESVELTRIIARLVPLAQERSSQDRLIYLLGRSTTAEALALATTLQSEPGSKVVATDAAMAVRSNLAGKPVVRASASERQVSNIMDGKRNSRWSVPARSDQWVEVDFRLSRPFRQIALDNNDQSWGYPEAYAVFVTDDPKNPGEAKASGNGQSGRTTINLPEGTRGRYLIIRHTADPDDAIWAISELVVD